MEIEGLYNKIQAGIEAYMQATYGYRTGGHKVYLDLKDFSYSYPGVHVGLHNGTAVVDLEQLLNPEEFEKKAAAEKEERELLINLKRKYEPAFNGTTSITQGQWPTILPQPETYFC